MSFMAKKDGPDGRFAFGFGIDAEAIATKLRWLADEIAVGRILPQRVSTSIENTNEDFELATLTVTYAEPKE